MSLHKHLRGGNKGKGGREEGSERGRWRRCGEDKQMRTGFGHAKAISSFLSEAFILELCFFVGVTVACMYFVCAVVILSVSPLSDKHHESRGWAP